MTRHVRFIVVAGPPCAGKSTMARYLARSLDAPHLEMDRFRQCVIPLSDVCVEHRDIAYRAMHITAELLARCCATIVLDATYTADVCRQQLCDVVKRVAGSLFVIECHVSRAIAAERFVRRGWHPAADLTAERVATLADDYRYFAGACAVGEGTDGDADLSAALEFVGARPLDRAGRASWCRQGRPREGASELRLLTPVVATTHQWRRGSSDRQRRRSKRGADVKRNVVDK